MKTRPHPVHVKVFNVFTVGLVAAVTAAAAAAAAAVRSSMLLALLFIVPWPTLIALVGSPRGVLGAAMSISRGLASTPAPDCKLGPGR